MTAPMLATPGGESFAQGVVRKVKDAAWGLEPKVDGHRLLVNLTGRPEGSGRAGQPAEIPADIERALASAGSAPLRLDGEVVGTNAGGHKLWLFDILGATVPEAWEDRRATLDGLIARWAPDPQLIRVVPWAVTQIDKAMLAQRVVNEGLEGLIAKRLGSRYEPGTRSTAWRKLKQVRSVDCIVTAQGIEGKRNHQLSLVRDGQLVVVGEVSALTGDADKIKVGDCVSVDFLYLGVNDRLVQPVTPRIRVEKSPLECTWNQLPPKPGELA